MKREDQHIPRTSLDPVVHPVVTDPRALNYAKAAKQRAMPRVDEASPGAVPVAMPPLEMRGASYEEKLTMEQQGKQYQDVLNQARSGALSAGNGPLFGGAHPSEQLVAPRASVTNPMHGLQRGDQLPESAMQDPQFQQGMGSMVAVNQPHLAMKYGVMRGGLFVPADHLKDPPQKGKIRESTAAGLIKLAEAQKEPVEEELKVEVAEAKSEDKEEDKSKKVLDKLDEFDWVTLREMINQDALNSPNQRKLIEARLEPLDIADLVLKEEVMQRIPINPKFEFTLCSTRWDEEIEIKRMALVQSQSLTGQALEQMVQDRYSLMSLAIHLYAINNTRLPSHRDADNKFDEKRLLEKLDKITRFPFHMLACVGTHVNWFAQRVRMLFTVDAVKNG